MAKRLGVEAEAAPLSEGFETPFPLVRKRAVVAMLASLDGDTLDDEAETVIVVQDSDIEGNTEPKTGARRTKRTTAKADERATSHYRGGQLVDLLSPSQPKVEGQRR